MPRLTEPKLLGDWVYDDPGHHYLLHWWPDERLRFTAHMFDTERQFQRAIGSLQGLPGVGDPRNCAGLCTSQSLRDAAGGRRWLSLDVWLSRQAVAKRQSTIWHELQHAVDYATAAGRLPKYMTRPGGKRSMPQVELRALFLSGLVESLLQWRDVGFGRDKKGIRVRSFTQLMNGRRR